MVAIDLPTARRLAFSVVLGQAVVTGIVALVSFAVSNAHAGLSAAVGGGIGTAASLAMALLVFNGRRADAQRLVTAFYLGEAVKVALAVVMFVVVLKTMKVAPLPLFAAYMATFLVYWVVLAKALPVSAMTGK